jgi:hypothetical protein
MRKSTCGTAGLAVLLAAVVAGSAVAAGGGAPSIPLPGERQAQPGVVVFKLRTRPAPGSAKTGFAAVDGVLGRHVAALTPLRAASHSNKAGAGVGLDRIYFAHYSDGAAPEAVASELRRLPDVEYAEPKWAYPLDAIPNDTNWSTQSPYMTAMHFPAGWDVSKTEGAVVVAVVDGGTSWTHVDLQPNVWINPGEISGNGLDDDQNGFIDDVHGWNFANDTNDPTGLPATPTNASHGSHTAGIVCAVTDNATGVAGASWNAKLMPICTSSPTNDNSIAFGYEGILYAADNGADIIIASWGGVGSASNFERDVIEYVWENGTAVVAAAGNNNTFQPHFPSAYPHVLSVANVSRFDVKDPSSNYGTTVDVSACGQSILSTVPPNAYGFLTGTSMSSPMAAGLCALVKKRWPGYTPDQVIERVRVTCDNIDTANPSRIGLLGYGRINAEAALTKNVTAVRITGVQFSETDGDGVIEPNETVNLTITVTNFLARATGLEFRLRETSNQASVADSVRNVAALDSLESVQLTGLTIQISPSAPIATVVDAILNITASTPAYTDKDRFSLTVQPTYVNQNVSLVKTSVTSVGKLGFSVAAGGNGNDGIGFLYDGSPNLLYEGALLIGTGVSKVSDGARGPSGTNPVPDDDFISLPGGVPHLFEPGQWAPQQTLARFDDSLAPSPLPVRVRQDTYEYVDPVHDDYIILRYTITNSGASTLSGLRVGWFCDWDIDGRTFDTNKTGFDATRQLGYAYDTGDGPTSYVGTSVLNSTGATAYRGIPNDPLESTDWGLYDGFADNEKWDCLAGGVVHPGGRSGRHLERDRHRPVHARSRGLGRSGLRVLGRRRSRGVAGQRRCGSAQMDASAQWHSGHDLRLVRRTAAGRRAAALAHGRRIRGAGIPGLPRRRRRRVQRSGARRRTERRAQLHVPRRPPAGRCVRVPDR